MWEQLSLPWQAALELAWEAYCDDCIPIGAVATDADGKLLSRGRNRIYSKRSADGRRHGNTLAHAEIEVLNQVDYEAFDPHTGVLYTTTEPCPMCLGTFYMSGFRTVHYASRDPYGGGIDLLGTTPYLRRKPIRVFEPFDPALENVLAALYLEYELVLGHTHICKTDLYPIWQQALPRAVEFGEALAQSGELRQRRQNFSAAQAFDWLLEKVVA